MKTKTSIFDLLDGPGSIESLACESFPECIGTRLDADAVLDLWQERSAIQETDNTDLIHWHHDNERSEAELRRACELCAAADMSLQHGRYVESIIRPNLANERD